MEQDIEALKDIVRHLMAENLAQGLAIQALAEATLLPLRTLHTLRERAEHTLEHEDQLPFPEQYRSAFLAEIEDVCEALRRGQERT
ncbi:hypothetical protein RBI22_15290 [Alcaligenaceae bacterium C4P045]|nr:hypothetical protein [Alcaligenaceae bacterium C4P045]